MISDYWFEKRDIPWENQKKIQSMVVGHTVDSIQIGTVSRKLFRVEGYIFDSVFTKNRRFLYRGEFTAPSEDNDYMHSSNYLTEDGLAGFSVTETGWLTSVFSNYRFSGFIKSVKRILIENANKLVCIVANPEESKNLIELYKTSCGFREYAVTTDDTTLFRQLYGDEYIDAFCKHNGVPHHVFLVRDNISPVNRSIKHFDDYYLAWKYVNQTVH